MFKLLMSSVLSLTTLLAAVTFATPAAAQEPIVLRTGSFAPPNSVFTRYWVSFKQNIETQSKGAIRVELNTNDPNEANLLSNVRRGRVECVGASLQGSSTVLPEIAVLQQPYLFSSFAQVDAAYDKGLADNFRRLFAARGLAMLQFVEVGFTHTYSTMPIRTPADVKGQKLRATQSRASQAWVRATGGEAVVLPIAEAVPGLQTGLIKGGESGVIVYGGLIAKAAPHYTLTAHAFDSGALLCNKEWYDKLKPEHQAIVTAAWDARAQARDARADNEKFLADAASRGITVRKPSAAELEAWRAVGKRAADELLAQMSPEARQIRDEIARDIAGVR
ncbi:MAG: TRAP transporter substrate-binding protein [Betaproteobacteria bacterium]|nr:TRAP transporter substrate-binding protein [Betaproteobacteria bacterium]